MYRVSVESRTAFFALSKYRQPRTVESCRKDILQSGDTAGNRQMAKRTSSVSLVSDPASLPDILQINIICIPILPFRHFYVCINCRLN